MIIFGTKWTAPQSCRLLVNFAVLNPTYVIYLAWFVSFCHQKILGAWHSCMPGFAPVQKQIQMLNLLKLTKHVCRFSSGAWGTWSGWIWPRLTVPVWTSSVQGKVFSQRWFRTTRKTPTSARWSSGLKWWVSAHLYLRKHEILSKWCWLHNTFENVHDVSPGPAWKRAPTPPSEHPCGGLPGVWSLHASWLSCRHISTQVHLQAIGQECQ